MSALQTSPGNNVVDPGHSLVELVQLVQPHLSHLISRPHQEPILGLNDEELSAVCHPLDRVYVMTTKGLANRIRPLFLFKSKPRLMSHYSIALIQGDAMQRVTDALETLLKQQIRLYGLRSLEA